MYMYTAELVRLHKHNEPANQHKASENVMNNGCAYFIWTDVIDNLKNINADIAERKYRCIFSFV